MPRAARLRSDHRGWRAIEGCDCKRRNTVTPLSGLGLISDPIRRIITISHLALPVLTSSAVHTSRLIRTLPIAFTTSTVERWWTREADPSSTVRMSLSQRQPIGALLCALNTLPTASTRYEEQIRASLTGCPSYVLAGPSDDGREAKEGQKRGDDEGKMVRVYTRFLRRKFILRRPAPFLSP